MSFERQTCNVAPPTPHSATWFGPQDPDPSNNEDKGHVNMTFENDVGPLCDQDNVSHDQPQAESAKGAEAMPVRDTWDNPIEFLLSCIASSVGLGNIWRFPFTAYENGGGAFLVPYLIVLTLIGRPMYFLELSLGQFSSYGHIKIWNLAPLSKGVGYGAMFGGVCVVTYYVSIMGLTVFYLFASFQKDLPWSVCDNAWVGLGAGFNKELNVSTLTCNDTDRSMAFNMNDGSVSKISVAQLYFENEVLQQKDQIDDGIGLPEWRLTLCLLFSWLLIWGSLVKGVSSSGKVAYFTALFPYVVLAIMFIRGVTLPGAWDGIKFFITPQWGAMLKVEVWYAAVGQCFFSLGTGFGSITRNASYNKFRHNVYRDAWIISGVDTLTSLFAGFTVFSVLGNLAQTLDTDIEVVAKAGPGLAFVSFPQGLSKFDWAPQLFSALFYLMLLTLGVGSANTAVGSVATVICDEFTKTPQWLITSGVCSIGFFVGLVYVTPGGQFILQMVDRFGANFVIYIMTIFEIITVAWVYGLSNIVMDIEFMLGRKIGWYWKFCWGVFIPVALPAILIYALATETRLEYNGWSYPNSAIYAGWTLATIAVSMLPVCAIHSVIKDKLGGSVFKRLRHAMAPKSDWGPRLPSFRAEWLQFKANLDKMSEEEETL